MGKDHEVIQGKTIDEKLQSIDGHLKALASRANSTKVREPSYSLVPMSLFLDQLEVGKFFFSCPGRIRALIVDVDECPKDTHLTIITKVDGATTSRDTKISKGLNKINLTLDIQSGTKLFFTHNLPVTNAAIAFTFQVGGTNETKVIPA